jgi:Predicted permease
MFYLCSPFLSSKLYGLVYENHNRIPSVLSIIIISIVSAVGLQLGKLKLLNISLGITFVFFVGIVIGHFNFDLNKDMLNFAQNFGLILFVYALGLQVGPGFFSSLRAGGLRMNMLALGVVFLGLILTVIFSYAATYPFLIW